MSGTAAPLGIAECCLNRHHPLVTGLTHHPDRVSPTVDITALNAMVRDRRQTAGELGEQIQLRNGKAFSVGDRLLLEKNEWVANADAKSTSGQARRLRVRNRTFGTVVAMAAPEDAALTRCSDVPERTDRHRRRGQPGH